MGDHAEGPGEPRESDWLDRRRFRWCIALIAAGALGLRIVYVLRERPLPISGDAIYYRQTARLFSEGRDIVNPVTMDPTAAHPPGWSLLLAMAELLGFGSVTAHQIFAALVGTVTVALVGFAASAVAGHRVGVISAAVAAIYPNLWLHERTLLSEVAVLPLVSLIVLVAHRHLRSPRGGFAVLLGALIGMLGLIRPEQLLLVPLLLVPLLLLAARSVNSARRRLSWCLLGSLAAGAVVLPWILYNAGRFDDRVLFSTNFGSTIHVANCPGTYEGELLGYVRDSCWRLAYLLEGDEAERDAQMRDRGLEYAGQHLHRLPAVIAAREGRTWGLYRPFQQARFDASFSGSSEWPYRAGVVTYWLLVPAAVAGTVLLRRRDIPTYVLLSFLVVVAVSTAITLGQSRIRAAAEVPIVILASVAFEHLGLLARRAGDGDGLVGADP